ncbi:hypothetical protein [Pseudonocardia humida]|uniref:DUF397 domain-containing protein n=1 Tax=Pseudonocardia humida TaxID=2800819 RepID=A0ABT0ZUS1_9PSEU|nr:hypothetical protein [Pseudonocardia humida]MCO1654474.1 hypothetical protein [Pseudonocardia humida]
MDAITAGWRAGSATGIGADPNPEAAFRPDGTVRAPAPRDRDRTPESRAAVQWSSFVSAVRMGQFAR